MQENVAQAATVSPFQIRGHSFTAVVLQLSQAPDQAFFDALEARMRQAPHFFQNAPFVLDLARAHDFGRSGDLARVVREMRSRRVIVVGVQNGTFEQNTAALQAGLVPMQGGREIPVTDEGRPDPAAEAAVTEEERATLLITEPVRSGQRIFADRGDIVVTASVGSGAELLAHGHIHVYGALRGRALAGINGDRRARVFCQSLEAELIAIAGLYKTSDDLGEAAWKQPVQAYLDDDRMIIRSLR